MRGLFSFTDKIFFRVLDISTSNDNICHQFQEPNCQLKRIVENLPNLASLDISGTNLAGFRKC